MVTCGSILSNILQMLVSTRGGLGLMLYQHAYANIPVWHPVANGTRMRMYAYCMRVVCVCMQLTYMPYRF